MAKKRAKAANKGKKGGKKDKKGKGKKGEAEEKPVAEATEETPAEGENVVPPATSEAEGTADDAPPAAEAADAT